MDWLKAIPALILMLKDLVDWVREITKDDPAKWIKETHTVITQVKAAKTVEEKQAAAVKLRDLIGGL